MNGALVHFFDDPSFKQFDLVFGGEDSDFSELVILLDREAVQR